MDFLSFLESNTNTNTNANTKTTIPIQASMNMEFKHIRQGMFVKVVAIPNSALNVYKGYKGEIKEYKAGNEYAVVVLHCINNLPAVKFPLNHFVTV
jgi:hypothetical protein